MYPDFKKFLSRDYFDRQDSSLSCSFVPQGLFRPARFISILIFCATGIISVGRMHLQLALLLRRDYFDRPVSSLPCSFSSQGLFPPASFISIFLFFSTGIISTGRFHLYLALFLHRDYFGRPDSSLSCSFSPQGLFRPAGFISILLFFSTGIISADQFHLYPALFLHRDYFGRPVSSLSCTFLPQGLLCPGQMHLYLALLFRRDYFDRPDSSLSCSFSPQRLFRPAGFISILLFFSTRIISASRMLLIAESISVRPFHQLPICLVMKRSDDLFTSKVYCESKPFYIKRLPYIA